MKKVLYVIWQWIWGLPQNLVGAALFLFYWIQGCPHFRYQGALVTVWPVRSGSMSMGHFLFMDPSWQARDHFLLAHEYGHTIQSLMLGPLFLPLVGLPSILWAGLPYFDRLRERKQMSYYDAYQEHWANTLGGRFALPENDPKELPLSRKQKNAQQAALNALAEAGGQTASVGKAEAEAAKQTAGKALPAAWKQQLEQAAGQQTGKALPAAWKREVEQAKAKSEAAKPEKSDPPV